VARDEQTETAPPARLWPEVARRRWWWAGIAVIVTVATVIGYAAGGPGESEYSAKALVVATQLEIRVENLPRTAAAIFDGGQVARLAAQRSATGIDPDDLIPDIVDLDPVENTQVLEITARHPEAELASRYANVVADALVQELNRIGPGLGQFTVNVRATVPDEPVAMSRRPTMAAGFVAGLALAAGFLALSALRVDRDMRRERRRREALVAERRRQAVDEIQGIGPVYASRLAVLGIEEVGQLAAADAAKVAEALGVQHELAHTWVERAQLMLAGV
jgi:uncharacterized protein involved in exopolysaccharide biosynthesis